MYLLLIKSLKSWLFKLTKQVITLKNKAFSFISFKVWGAVINLQEFNV